VQVSPQVTSLSTPGQSPYAAQQPCNGVGEGCGNGDGAGPAVGEGCGNCDGAGPAVGEGCGNGDGAGPAVGLWHVQSMSEVPWMGVPQETVYLT